MSIQYMIEVMQAFATGLPIELKDKNSDVWLNALHVTWDWSKYDYRIKNQTVLLKPALIRLGDSLRISRVLYRNMAEALKSGEDVVRLIDEQAIEVSQDELRRPA